VWVRGAREGKVRRGRGRSVSEWEFERDCAMVREMCFEVKERRENGTYVVHTTMLRTESWE
jgi:hypothetical protein